jgi:hypothetical protein
MPDSQRFEGTILCESRIVGEKFASVRIVLAVQKLLLIIEVSAVCGCRSVGIIEDDSTDPRVRCGTFGVFGVLREVKGVVCGRRRRLWRSTGFEDRPLEVLVKEPASPGSGNDRGGQSAEKNRGRECFHDG